MQTSLLQEQRNEEQEARDLLCSDSEVVKIWRDQFKMNCNRGFKFDMNVTIKDLRLWKFVVSRWGFYQKNGRWKSFNPLAVNHQISEYERLAGSREAREIAGYE